MQARTLSEETKDGIGCGFIMLIILSYCLWYTVTSDRYMDKHYGHSKVTVSRTENYNGGN